jgi:hypothetical protein
VLHLAVTTSEADVEMALTMLLEGLRSRAFVTAR